jgi:hypothetical protein
MGSRKAKNPTGYYKAARMSIYEALHGYDRLQKAVVFHGWNSFVNRLVRTRMPGGVGRGSREASPYPIVEMSYQPKISPAFYRRHREIQSVHE